jgi:membrane protease YdiL (CAAX protease family)
MSGSDARRVGFWRVVWLLLASAYARSVGRHRRQRQLLRKRTGGSGSHWGGFTMALQVLVMGGLNLVAALLVIGAVTTGERIVAEQRGWVIVDDSFLHAVTLAEARAADPLAPGAELDQEMAKRYGPEARSLADRYGGDRNAIERRLRETVRKHNIGAFTRDTIAPGLTGLPGAGNLPAMFGGLALLWWGLMLVFQGEGLELDVQRRRHPMWEWLFSHPVPAGAIFLAEMLSPLAANPIFYCAPLMPGILYGSVYGIGFGILAVALIGIPVTVALACLGKALEIGVLLRFAPRSRGAVLGLMGWVGYSTMVLMYVTLALIGKIVTALAGTLQPLTHLPWPWLGLFLGLGDDGAFSFARGLLYCWGLSLFVVAGSVAIGVWGARQGLAGRVGAADTAPRGSAGAAVRWKARGEPLHRKELLWFARDRSALLQAVLIPLTAAAPQLFNMRGLLAVAPNAWNYLCGAGILFGTYFIGVLGPKSLASEGTALWIPLTWPRGLESLLKAKARLWATISTAMVGMVLAYAVYRFPASAWKVGLVGVGWYLFARSMAEKTVTLATVTADSGEVGKVPFGRRAATYLGTMSFAIGVLTQQWNVAIAGIVYSMITAAAMWQNFRARLPFLFDPWSETLPPAPTLMHAMVGIGILVEGVAVVTGGARVFRPEHFAVARAVAYAIWATLVAVGMSLFLYRRGVRQRDVWLWPQAPGRSPPLARSLLMGVAGGLALGLVGLAYLAALHGLPETAELLDQATNRVADIPHLQVSLFAMAVFVAPVAEEFLFRGLLYRALDREWGGWRAMLGSAAFFAVYHPALSWLPVGLLGLVNASLFKRTGRLAPAVLLHMVYNAVVLGV